MTAWNGLAIGALAAASQTLQKEDPPVPPIFPIEGRQPQEYLEAAVQVRFCLLVNNSLFFKGAQNCLSQSSMVFCMWAKLDHGISVCCSREENFVWVSQASCSACQQMSIIKNLLVCNAMSCRQCNVMSCACYVGQRMAVDRDDDLLGAGS